MPGSPHTARATVKAVYASGYDRRPEGVERTTTIIELTQALLLRLGSTGCICLIGRFNAPVRPYNRQRLIVIGRIVR